MQKIKDVSKGDVLAFKASDNKYKLVICTSYYKDRSPFRFNVAALNYSSDKMPVLDDVLDCEFYGIGNRINEYFKYSQKELDKMWTIHPEIKPYSLGTYGLLIYRKDFIKFRDNFELICNLDIVDNLHINGNGGMNASALHVLDDLFVNKLPILENVRGQRRFRVQAIIRD